MKFPSYLLPALLSLPLATQAAALTPPAPQEQGSEQLSAQDLVKEGRSLLREGRAAEALELLTRADELDGGKLETRRWRIAAMIANGETNDALDLTEEARAAQTPEQKASKRNEPTFDYLFGLAFDQRARQHIADNSGGGLVPMNFGDATTYLSRALEAEPELFADAWLTLCEAAWNVSDLETARRAAEGALKAFPGGAHEQFWMGQVCLSQYLAVREDESKAKQATQRALESAAAFDACIGALGQPKQTRERVLLAQAAIQKAYLLIYQGRLEDSAEPFGIAMSWDPTQVDFTYVHGQLKPESFLATLERAAAAFKKTYGKRTSTDATLQWWLGWGRYNAKQYAQAEEAYALALEKWPAYTNTRWYIALCRYHGQSFVGAVDAVLEFWDTYPEQLVATIRSDAQRNIATLDGLISWCARNAKLVEAARLSSVQASVDPTEARYSNNAGLFYRDAGDSLKGSEDAAVVKRRMDLYERSLAAYKGALELEPDNPAFLNDTAVVLDYCLDRDHETAKSYYKRAREQAELQLKRKDLSPSDRQVIQIARRDSGNNLRILERRLKKRAEEEQRRKEAEEEARRKKEQAGGA